MLPIVSTIYLVFCLCFNNELPWQFGGILLFFLEGIWLFEKEVNLLYGHTQCFFNRKQEGKVSTQFPSKLPKSK